MFQYSSHLYDFVLALAVLHEGVDFFEMLRVKCETLEITDDNRYLHPHGCDYILLVQCLMNLATKWEKQTVLLYLHKWEEDLLDIENGVKELQSLCEEFNRLLREGATVVELKESILKQDECAKRHTVLITLMKFIEVIGICESLMLL